MNRNGQLFVPSPPRSAAQPKRYGAGYVQRVLLEVIALIQRLGEFALGGRNPRSPLSLSACRGW